MTAEKSDNNANNTLQSIAFVNFTGDDSGGQVATLTTKFGLENGDWSSASSGITVHAHSSLIANLEQLPYDAPRKLFATKLSLTDKKEYLFSYGASGTHAWELDVYTLQNNSLSCPVCSDGEQSQCSFSGDGGTPELSDVLNDFDNNGKLEIQEIHRDWQYIFEHPNEPLRYKKDIPYAWSGSCFTKKQQSQGLAQSISIPLTIIKTNTGVSDGEGGKSTEPSISIPKTIAVNIPQYLTDRISAYAIAEYNKLGPIVLGPKGWIGEGKIGANGNTEITIKPANAKGSISYYEVPSCDACFHWSAGQYFPKLAEEAKDNPLWKVDPIPQLKIISIGSQIVSYSLPRTKDGLEINGRAFAKMTNNQYGKPFIKLEASLPSDQQDLSAAILKYLENNPNQN